MRFRVFHAKGVVDVALGGHGQGRVVGVRGRFGFDPTVFPDDFTHVADVEAPEIGAVFQLTNHIDAPWTDNAEVTIPDGVVAALLRSTSVGDLIQDDSGRVFLVAPVGLRLLKPSDGGVVHVPGRYGRLDDA